MEKPFAFYTIQEVVTVEDNGSVFKNNIDKLIKVHRLFGVPILRITAEKIVINKSK